MLWKRPILVSVGVCWTLFSRESCILMKKNLGTTMGRGPRHLRLHEQLQLPTLRLLALQLLMPPQLMVRLPTLQLTALRIRPALMQLSMESGYEDVGA